MPDTRAEALNDPDALDRLRFDNRFTRELRADPVTRNTPRQVQGAIYSRVAPRHARAPLLLAHSRELLAELGWPAHIVESPNFAEVFAGNRVLAAMDPHAMCYGGHQFGHWAGQLGDGRAINLGEAVAADGRLQMLQLKGAGPTPYSRAGDGLAVLRSSVREFLCSEAMFHLGVPTTRALCLVTTGELVTRDMFYDGHPEDEPGAIVCRVAPSFLRFGNFEILAATRQDELLRELVEFTIRTLYPEFVGANGTIDAEHIVGWFETVCTRTAEMIVHWQRVGFVHGVMNTDNMSILGLTIDYGPYGWLEDYDPNWTPNTTDASHRRYRFGSQGQIAMWNTAQLGNALVGLVGDVAPLQRALDGYAATFDREWHTMVAHKLGLRGCDEAAGDRELFVELFGLLAAVETDMTLFFRALAALPIDGATPPAADRLRAFEATYYTPDNVTDAVRARTLAWLDRYATRIRSDGRSDAERRALMDAVNPKFVLRNYLAQLAIDDATAGDPRGIRELLDVLRRPYDEQPHNERFAAKRPEWARHRPGCSSLSCSS